MKRYKCASYEADTPNTPIAGQMALTDSPFIYAEYFEPSKEDIENARTVTNCVFPISDNTGRLK